MSDSVRSQIKVLKQVEEELWKIPAHVMPAGKGIQNPTYREQTQRLEAMMAQLSLAIRAVQNNPQSKGPDAQKGSEICQRTGEEDSGGTAARRRKKYT